MAGARKTISKEEWQEALSGCAVDKRRLDRMLLEYFVSEGHLEVAQKFAEEAGLPLACDQASLQLRSQIRASIHKGDVQTAIEAVNDAHPETLDRNTALFFRLNIQRLIELIQQGKVAEALQFARSELATLGSENPALLGRLEEAMALLAFADRANCPVSHLLSPAQRQITASLVNAAVLDAEQMPHKPQLLTLLRGFVWAQNQFATRVTFPTMSTVGVLESPAPQ